MNAFIGLESNMAIPEDAREAVDAAEGPAAKHAALVESKKGKSALELAKIVDGVLNKVGDDRPNPSKNVYCRIVGVLNGEGTPSQQLAKYQKDVETIEKFAGFQNVTGIYPASNCTINDTLSFSLSRRHWAKFNTQTIHGKTNFARIVSSTVCVSNNYSSNSIITGGMHSSSSQDFSAKYG